MPVDKNIDRSFFFERHALIADGVIIGYHILSGY